MNQKIVLGTVKIGRNTQVKYPSGEGAPLPSDTEVSELIRTALENGVYQFDTAPSYGTSEARLGNALKSYSHYPIILSTKVGEIFDGTNSTYCFEAEYIEQSVQNSLQKLGTKTLNYVWLHLPKNDLEILQNSAALSSLKSMQEKGIILNIGASTMSVEGGIFAAENNSIQALMVAYNIQYQKEWPVIEKAFQNSKKVWIKKGLLSGHVSTEFTAQKCLQFLLSKKEITSVVVGTKNPKHLLEAVQVAQRY